MIYSFSSSSKSSYRARVAFAFAVTFCSVCWAEGSFASTEDVKRLYVEKKWDSFFARVILARDHFYSQDEKASPLQDEVFGLEILALARHCQWHAVDQVLENHKDHLNQLPLTDKAYEVVQLKKAYQTYKKDQSDQPIGYKKAKRAWPVKLKEAKSSKVKTSNWRVHVESLCVK